MYEPSNPNSSEATDSIASSIDNSSHSSADFFAQQEAQEQAKQAALSQLAVYAGLMHRSFSAEEGEFDGRVAFLKPIGVIYSALRSYLDLPVEENRVEQVVIHRIGNASSASLGLEAIDFLTRLQRAIVDVEATPLLTAANYTALYWQFLYPLYQSCERVVKANFWPIHPLAEGVRWLSYEVTKGSDAAPPSEVMNMPLLASLAYTLIAYYLDASSKVRDSALQVVVASYGQLPYRLQLELLEVMTTPSIQAWIVSRYPNENLRDLFSTLRAYRNEDGSSAQQVTDYETWLELANQLLANSLVKQESQREHSTRADDICIRLRDMRFINDRAQVHQAEVVEYRIKAALYPQFLAQDSQQRYTFKSKENKVGRHTVYPIHLTENRNSRPELWMKLLPEQPGIEFAIYRLAERLGLGGVVPGVIGNIRLNGKDKGQAVWISADAGWQSEQIGEIKNLAEVIEKEPELLNKIDGASLTRAILRVLWSNPEDDKGNDYLLISFMQEGALRYRVVRIDNERAFFPVEKQETLGLVFSQTVLQVKSLLYCLAQMQQPLDEEVLKEFAALDMYQVLKAWIDELQLEHPRYKELFTEAEIREHFPKDSPDITILAVMVHEKLMPELLGRLQLIQHTIRGVVDRQETLTGLALLRHVQPTLVNKGQETYHYAKAFMDYPAPHHVKERFEQLTKGQYSAASSQVNQMSVKSAALSAQQSLRLERSLTVTDVWDSLEGKKSSPSQAQQQLEQLANRNTSAIWHNLLSRDMQPQTEDLAAFSELPIKQRATLIAQASKVLAKNPDAYTLTQQETILKAIATATWQRLTLGVFANALTPQLFQTIIDKTAGALVHLDISQCWQLKENEIALIVNQCYLLESLDISGLPIKQLTISQPWVTSWLLPKLMVLTARRCQNLQSIAIDLPALERLEAEDCVQLTDLRANVRASARAILAGCEKLLHAALKSVLPLTSMGDARFLDTLWESVPARIKTALACYARGERGNAIEKAFSFIGRDESLELRHAAVLILLQLSVETLNLDNHQIGTKGAEWLSQALMHNSSLTMLDLSYNQIGDKGAEWLSQALMHNSSLKKLDLYGNQIGAKGAEWLSQALMHNSSLTTLVLYDNQIGVKGAAFKQLIEQRLRANPRVSLRATLNKSSSLLIKPNCPREHRVFSPPSFTLPTLSAQLASLNLTHQGADDKHIEQLLAACHTYPRMALKELILAKNQITNEGLTQLSQQFIPKLPELIRLNLAENDFNEFGLAPLINALAKHSPPLQQLDISGNKIGDNGMQILAEYLRTNTRLHALSIRDTDFSENRGYQRFIACFKQNFTLLTVNIRGNLLISPESHTQLTALLKRNQDLQPDISRLQKAESHYIKVLKNTTNQIIFFFNRKKVGDLNTIQALLEQLQSLWSTIEGDYHTIKLAIKKEGNEESHPLLNALNKAQQQQRELEKRCRDYKAQLSQPDYCPAWQSNRVTIRIWMTNLNKGQVGHVSVATSNSYLSFWPKETPTSWQVITGSGTKATFHRLIDDEKAEGPDWEDNKVNWPAKRRRVAGKIIVLYSLDSKAIEKMIQALFEEGNRYSLINKSKAKFSFWQQADDYKQLGNCCDKACEVTQNQIERLTGELLERQFGMATPDAILKWAEVAKQKEVSRYPHTKGFTTLRLEECSEEKIYPGAFVQQPSIEARRSYSEKGLFFGFKRRADEKLNSELQQWSETPNPTYVASADYDTAHDEEVALKAGDLVEDLTPVLDAPDFKRHLPHDMWPQDGTKNPNLPGWVHFKSVHSAKVQLEHDIPGTSLQKDMELKLIGKKGSLQDDDCVIICQQDNSVGSKKYSLHRRNVRFMT